ncbi:hypothetical protein GA0074692_4267 [Micromonospora pallida]|uniref:Uncharacterized protein n=1 Tax=Micromonospora pallida TaxID=145854 RepID=A0A1C6T2R8_9ACTN|nr:hypothetical protein GA0074692_4267 [Micromonospora pallida]
MESPDYNDELPQRVRKTAASRGDGRSATARVPLMARPDRVGSPVPDERVARGPPAGPVPAARLHHPLQPQLPTAPSIMDFWHLANLAISTNRTPQLHDRRGVWSSPAKAAGSSTLISLARSASSASAAFPSSSPYSSAPVRTVDVARRLPRRCRACGQVEGRRQSMASAGRRTALEAMRRARRGRSSSPDSLGWTCPKIRTPQAADRWAWMILAAYTQLRLARALAIDLRRPWEQPAPPERLSPGTPASAEDFGTSARRPRACRTAFDLELSRVVAVVCP